MYGSFSIFLLGNWEIWTLKILKMRSLVKTSGTMDRYFNRTIHFGEVGSGLEIDIIMSDLVSCNFLIIKFIYTFLTGIIILLRLNFTVNKDKNPPLSHSLSAEDRWRPEFVHACS